MSIDVFLSYARKDRDLAEKLFVELEKHGLEVWWDFGLLPGDEFAEKILGVIEISALTVVLWSENSTKSRWVLSEADLADRRGSLFPITIDDSPVPMPFSRIHAARLDRIDNTPDMQGLAVQIVTAVAEKRDNKPSQYVTPINDERAARAREVLRTFSQDIDSDIDSKLSEDEKLSTKFHDKLEELLSPLQKLDELENLTALRTQAEIANRRPRLSTRFLLFTVATVSALAGIASILTYADISSSDIVQLIGWDKEDEKKLSEYELNLDHPKVFSKNSKYTFINPDSCEACPEMVLLEGGSFLMGSKKMEKGHRTNEGPLHPVTIGDPFYVSAHEITVNQWRLCSTKGPCEERAEHRTLLQTHPITYVSWEDANIFAVWLSEVTGQTYRLLSEAEWEYAARAGTSSPFPYGETITSDQANYDARSVYGLGRIGDYRSDVGAVGSFPPNAFGLFDIIGNASEWVMDCWNPSYIGKPRDSSDTGQPWLEGACYRRAVRGGSWASPPVEVRSASRDFHTRSTRSSQIGFRVAREY